MKNYLDTLILTVLIPGCASFGLHEEKGSESVVAELSGEPETNALEDYRVDILLRNSGSTKAKLNLTILRNAICSINVHDSNGKIVPTLPPSAFMMPSFYSQHEWIRLVPGEEYSLTVRVGSFSYPQRRGYYKISMAGIEGNELRVLNKAEERKQVEQVDAPDISPR